MHERPSFGKRVAAARKRRSITQEEFGAHFGKGQPWVSKLEDGKIPVTLDLMREAAKVLGVPPRDLIPPESTRPAHSGFSECSVAPWTPPAAEGGTTTSAFSPAMLAPGAGNPATFHVAHDRAANFGFPRGTVLVVDFAAVADEGDLGIATLVDQQTGVSRTILGRRLGDYLIGPNFAANPADRTYVDQDEVGAIFPVVSWFRGPEFAKE